MSTDNDPARAWQSDATTRRLKEGDLYPTHDAPAAPAADESATQGRESAQPAAQPEAAPQPEAPAAHE